MYEDMHMTHSVYNNSNLNPQAKVIRFTTNN